MEIDNGNATASSSVEAAALPSSASTAERAVAIMRTAVESRDWPHALAACEALELLACAAVDESDGALPIPRSVQYTAHMLCCLLNNELEKARHLWKRCPIQDPLVENSWKVTCALLEGVANTTQAISQCSALLKRADAHTFITDLATSLIEHLRTSIFKTIGMAYETIELSEAASLLALDEQQTKAKCTAAGWRTDGGLLFPLPGIPVQQKNGMVPTNQLHQICQYITHLETK